VTIRLCDTWHEHTEEANPIQIRKRMAHFNQQVTR